MKEIDLNKTEKIKILKKLVSKYLPNESLLYNEKGYLIVTSDKRFGIHSILDKFYITYKPKVLFGRTKTRVFYSSVIKKIVNGGTPVGEIWSNPIVDENNFQNNDFQLLSKLYEIYIKYNDTVTEVEKNRKEQQNEQRRQEKKLKQLEKEKLQQEKKIREKKRLKELKVSQNNILNELDKDGNGEVDVVEGVEFEKLLRKHQKSIIEVDRNYVQQFVKLSSFLKLKKENIQLIFNSLKHTPNQKVLKEYVEILKDEIHNYNLLLFNSLNMIVSLVENDMITFYEIHEIFDNINIFDTKHEKDVSEKLTNIGNGISDISQKLIIIENRLKDLMFEVRRTGPMITDSVHDLNYVTEESNRQLENQLRKIDSTLQVGNLISTINTYQNYKNNRKLNR